MTTAPKPNQRPSWTSRFWAIFRYEMLWNIRKKKFIGIIIAMFIIATLIIVLPVAISVFQGVKIAKNPDYAISFGGSGFVFILLAIATAVNTFSSEFESGSIVPLVTKPVSRTMIFLGKLFGAFVILLVSYVILYGYITGASALIYGPQNNLQYMPIIVLGSLMSTFIWVALLFAVGTIIKEHHNDCDCGYHPVPCLLLLRTDNRSLVRSFSSAQLFPGNRGKREHFGNQCFCEFRHRRHRL